jgi:hypothetical protein
MWDGLGNHQQSCSNQQIEASLWDMQADIKLLHQQVLGDGV